MARGDQIHILNILKQHYRVTDIAQVTEEMARAAFEDRKIMQGAVDLDAQQALNRRIQTFRADQIRRNQESMLPGPKTFTRDALFREAEEALGADQAHDFMAIQDSLAQHWAEENGRSADEWYEAQIWQRGGYDGGEGLAQEVGVGVKNRSLTNSELANYARSLIRAGEDDVRRAVSYEDSRKAKIALLDAVYQIDPQMAKRVARRVDGLAQVNDTPAFRAWFADSKVVGQDGKPLLVYHGTNKLFNQFDASYSATNDFPGFFFTQDARNASMYASSWGTKNAHVIPAYVKISNPADETVLRAIAQETGLSRKRQPAAFRAELERRGYDGIMTSSEVVVFDPTNIKSPFNSGTFDPNSPEFLNQGYKAVTRWLDNGKALVHAYESADISTFAHETAHVLLPMMGERDIRTIERWLAAEYGVDGLPPGWQYGTAQHKFVTVNGRELSEKELFARGFERYLAEGEAPTPALKRVFENFKRYLITVYQKISGSEIDIKLTPEITDLFDSWLGKKTVRDFHIGDVVEYGGKQYEVGFASGGRLKLQDIETHERRTGYASPSDVTLIRKPQPETAGLAKIGSVVTFERDGKILTATITEDHGQNYDFMGRATDGYDYPIPRDGIIDIIENGQPGATGTTPDLFAQETVNPAPATEPQPAAALEEPAAGPAVPPQPQVGAPEGITIRRNKAQGGIEVRFDQKPDQATLDQLRARGYRWSKGNKVWYKKEKPGEWDSVHSLLGPAPAETPMPAATHWPTWEEWSAGTQGDRNHYDNMIVNAVQDGEIGYDEALKLVGQRKAGHGMLMRYMDNAKKLTLSEFVDNLMTYIPGGTRDEFEKLHADLIKQAVDSGKAIPDEILRDYPDLYITRDTPEPPKSVFDGVEPGEQGGLFNAPQGQGSLFGEETAGFGLQAQNAPNETFKPQANDQSSLFGMGEYLQPGVKGAKPVEDTGNLGPLFENPARRGGEKCGV